MSNHPPQEFVDTVQIEPEDRPAAPDADASTQGEQADFAATVQIEGAVWAESPDFQSSDRAALFAGTQPGKLDVV
jgi:hypothetical protein